MKEQYYRLYLIPANGNDAHELENNSRSDIHAYL